MKITVQSTLQQTRELARRFHPKGFDKWKHFMTTLVVAGLFKTGERKRQETNKITE